MKLSFSPTEQKVIDILMYCGGSEQTIGIVEEYQRRFPRIPKQTIYRSLRSLRKKEVITIVKGVTTANTIWLHQLRTVTDILESKVKVLDLPDRQAFVFPSLLAAAPTLAHYAYILIGATPADSPVIFVNPQQWFYLVRESSELHLVARIAETHHTLLQGITNINPLNTWVMKKYFGSNKQLRASYMTLPKADEHKDISIYGDWVIEVLLAKNIRDSINGWFKEQKKYSAESLESLRSILKMPGEVKITIYRNTTKATKYRQWTEKFFS